MLRELLKDNRFDEILGMDVSVRALEIAANRLKIDDLPSFQAERIKLIHGSLMYRDNRLAEFDAATRCVFFQLDQRTAERGHRHKWESLIRLTLRDHCHTN